VAHLAGAVTAIVYGTVRFPVLRPADAVKRATYTLHVFVAFAFFLESFFALLQECIEAPEVACQQGRLGCGAHWWWFRSHFLRFHPAAEVPCGA
jgi:hypothetical protein